MTGWTQLGAEDTVIVGIVGMLLTAGMSFAVWLLARRESRCPHPFEQAFPGQTMWRCPRCGDEFHKQATDGGQWRLLVETTAKE